MRIRHLVPALGALALIAPIAGAQEVAKGVNLSAWVDTNLTVTSVPNGDDLSSAAADQNGYTDASFYSAGKIALTYSPVERVTTKLGIRANNSTPTGSEWQGAGVTADELFGTVDLTNGFSVTIGKFVNHIGWTSYEPMGLYRVNAGIIPGNFYGANNPIGANVAFAKDDVPVSGSVHVVNGYQNDTGFVGGTDHTKKNYGSFGLGADVTYTLPNGLGNINAEVAFDGAGSDSSTPDDEKSWIEYGVNATIKPVEKVTLGAEVIFNSYEKAAVAGSTPPVAFEDKDLTGLMGMVNYAFEAGVPMSATLMVENVKTKQVSDVSETEVAAALLTNPLSSGNFGLNLEIAHLSSDDTTADGTLTVAIEALFVLP